MELPLYLSFKDFENTYYDNLEKWFEEYQNTSETDYLKALSDLYSPYLYYNFANDRLQADASYRLKTAFFLIMTKSGFLSAPPVKTESLPKFQKNQSSVRMENRYDDGICTAYLDKINRYLSKNSNKEDKNVLDFINDFESSLREGAGYCVNYNQHQATIPFLKAYLPVHGQTVNIAVYRDFLFPLFRLQNILIRN
jgi:hypothetical protein